MIEIIGLFLVFLLVGGMATVINILSQISKQNTIIIEIMDSLVNSSEDTE